MTASSITYLVAREHITYLQREAHHRRLVAELSTPRRVRLAVPRLLARGVASAATA